MGFKLDNVVPWGRSYEEYVSMFALADVDLALQILGCGDGPAAFNAKLTQRGGRVVSIDPIYAFSVAQIKERIAITYESVMIQLRANQRDYVWNAISSLDELGRVRMAAMDTFLADFSAGKNGSRYVVGELPSLPFTNAMFDFALSSHFLFLYSAQLSAEFHLQAILEMLRVAREVRIFPLLTLDGVPSPHLDFVNKQLISHGFNVELRRVAYEFQRGGNEMLVIRPA